jgi:DNA repair exonuclease SbcCD ATPase subunit
MHTEVEVIFNGGVDHVHADILHRFIDEQQAEIERLYGLRDHWTALVEEHEAEIERRLVEAAHYAEAYNREGIANNKLRAEIERLKSALEVCEVPVKRQRKEIERLEAERETWDGHKVCKLLRSDLADAADRIERLEDDLAIALENYKTQMEVHYKDRDRIERLIVDQDQYEEEIERLSTRNKNQCERLDQQIKHNADLLNRNAKLQAVVDAAREIVEGPHKNWPKLREALEALEGGDE